MPEAAKLLLNELSQDYDDVARGLARMTKHIGAHGDEAIAEAAHEFVRSASKLADKIKAQSATISKTAGEEIREHPIATAAIAAAAVGLLGYAVTQAQRPK